MHKLTLVQRESLVLIYHRPQNAYGSYNVDKHRSLPMPSIHLYNTCIGVLFHKTEPHGYENI
jgi:hypothetical protein